MKKAKSILVLVIATILVCGIIAGSVTLALYFDFKEAELNLPVEFTVTAHTGPEGTPYNSIEGMQKGIASGANIIEFDLNDHNGTPVLSHNKPKGDEVLFSDALDILVANPTIRANIDVKTTTPLKAAYQLIEAKNLKNRVFFTGVKESYVSAVKENCPDIAFFLNVTPRLSTSSKYYEGLAKKVKDYGAIGANCNYLFANKLLVDTFHNEGLLVSLWTANDEFSMIRCLSYAPDNITTKQPSQLISIINSK